MSRISKSKLGALLFHGVSLAVLLIALTGCSPSEPKARPVFEVEREQSQDREWRKATMTGEYERIGHKDPKWDEPAKEALDLLAGSDQDDRTEKERDAQRISHYVTTAVQAGCDDPMINYLRVMYNGPGTTDTNAAIETFQQIADSLNASDYPNIRKFYGCLRTAGEIRKWDWKNRAPTISDLELKARNYLVQALDDKNMPPKEARDACVAMLEQVKNWKAQFEPTYRALEKPLDKNFSASTAPDAVKGAFYIDYAWEARGSGYSDTVTQEGWKLFGERLETARKALEKGWRQDPGDPFMPTKMLTVMMGESRSWKESGLWFDRAMTAYSNNWNACNLMLLHLEPKWGGSTEAMLAFGRECRTNEAWGWDVRLMIVDAQWRVAVLTKDRNGYLSQPAVWEEIHSAYADYFKDNPDSVYHRNYAWYAYVAQDWAVVNEQLPFLGEDDYAYFGGKEAFDKIAREAKSHAKG